MSSEADPRSSSDIDRFAHIAAIAIGGIVLVVGLGALVLDPVASLFPVTNVPIVAAGLLAIVLGLWTVRVRYRATGDRTHVPDVEYLLPTPAPGHEIDNSLYRLTRLREGTTEIRDSIQERLAEAAIQVIRQRENCAREEAIRQLQEGTWTDDDTAAGFFTGQNAPQQRPLDRVFGSQTSVYERWVEQTVEAIEDRAELTDEDAGVTETEDGSLLVRLGLRSEAATTSRPIRPGYQTRSSRDEAREVAPGVTYADLLTTGQWTGISAFALLTAGIGLVSYTPSVFLLSVIGVGFATYARAATPPNLQQLAVDREFDESAPDPGEVVEVTVTVTNESGSFLPDLRLVDQVPGSFRVVNGTPRLGTTLSSGDTATFSYEVIVERGEHEWPLLAVGRDVSGTLEREATIESDDELTCFSSLRTVNEMPVRSLTSLFSGQVETSMGGSGLEFHSVREYRQGDPMKRIDWKRFASSGELATIDFRLERAAQVVLLFDARDSAFLSPHPTEYHALDRGVMAASEAFAALEDRGDLVGIAAFDTVPCWLGPGAGDGHMEAARRLLATHPALSSTPPQLSDHEGHYIDPMTHVRRQLSEDAQIVLFSPLCDDYAYEVARQLDSAGHPVTLISPDPTADRTVGQRLARIERQMRVAQLREHGVRVIDWKYGQMLGLSLDRAQMRWAQ